MVSAISGNGSRPVKISASDQHSLKSLRALEERYKIAVAANDLQQAEKLRIQMDFVKNQMRSS